MKWERPATYARVGVPAVVAAIVLISVIVPAGQANGATSHNWSMMNADASGTNYFEQDQIGTGNAGQLTLKWLFPFPESPSGPGANQFGAGVISPPLSVDGIVYVVTNFFRVYAINAYTGGEVWHYDLSVDVKGLPVGAVLGHMHGINYYRGDVWVSLPDCSVDALDALTGTLAMRIENICAGVPGNVGVYDSSGIPPVFLGNTMIWTSSVTEGTNAGRGFVAAFDLTTQRLLWRWYVSPPAGGDPNWDTSSCPPRSCHGNVVPVTNDWGTMGYNGTATLAGAGPAWGQPAIDVARGMAYIGTSQPSPDWNATYRPGPNLYSDSVVALNITNGHMVWFFQTTPHDLFDFDCGWNVVLGNITEGGRAQEAVLKACKNGYVYALDAASGNLLWYFDPPGVARLGTGNADYVKTGRYDGTQAWINYPSIQPSEQCPGINGGVESDISLAYGKLYVATHNFCTMVQVAPVGSQGNEWGVKYAQPDWLHANTTVYALDASTGRQIWSYFIPGIPFRGWLTASGGMVLVSSLDGNVHFLDANSGAEVYKLHLGPSLYEGMTAGLTASGEVQLYQLVSSPSYGSFAGSTPGVLLAFGLSHPAGVNWVAYVTLALAGIAAATAAFVARATLVRRRSTGAQDVERGQVAGSNILMGRSALIPRGDSVCRFKRVSRAGRASATPKGIKDMCNPSELR